MIVYAVNRFTKEHRRADTIAWQCKYSMDWLIVEADADGWIEWSGGECPLQDDAWAEVKMRDGLTLKGRQTRSAWLWKHYGCRNDIIAYRPILEPQADQTKEWRGPEDGLPPVGAVCEYRLGDSVNWFACKIVMHVGTQGTVMERSDIFEGIQYCSANGNQAVHFRPIRTDRERWIDRACAVEYCMPDGYQPRELLEALYDTGLARLPEDV